MKEMYYETIQKLEKTGVNSEYVHGWASGFLGNPRREEQRTNAAYEAGYEDGSGLVTNQAEQFTD